MEEEQPQLADVSFAEPTESVDLDGSNSEEAGYVIPLTALLLIPLLIFAAFAVDVGSWYLKGQEVQRAADAAALASVIYMPDIDQAEEVAIDLAARNGLIDQKWIDAGNPGVANAQVVVSEKGDRVRVQIFTDTPAFLGKIVLDQVTIERFAVADIATDVGFGNPTSGLGTGNLGPDVLGVPPGGGSYAHGLWLAVNSHCLGYSNGDPFSAGFAGTRQPWNGCTDTRAFSNPAFKGDQDMYDYVVDIPHGISGSTDIQVFEPGVCTTGIAQDPLVEGPRLQFRVYESDATVGYDFDNLARPPVYDNLFPRDACTGGDNGWYTLATVPASEAGRWYVRANSRANQDPNELGTNNFALRAVPSGGNGFLCSRSSANPTCPSLYAREWASFYRPSWGAAGVPTEFFLAQIGEEHAGKVVQIRLFDPGEGMQKLEFIDDSNTNVRFSFRRTNCSVANFCGISSAWREDTLANRGSSCSGGPCLWVSGSRYDSQWVTLEYLIPSTYTCASSCWWKVRYTPEPRKIPTDRTTWSVKVVGDPAQLTE